MFLTHAVESTCPSDTGFLPLSYSVLFLFPVVLVNGQCDSYATNIHGMYHHFWMRFTQVPMVPAGPNFCVMAVAHNVSGKGFCAWCPGDSCSCQCYLLYCRLQSFHHPAACANIAAATSKITDAAGTTAPLPLTLQLLHCPRHQTKVHRAGPGGTRTTCMLPSLEDAGYPVRGERHRMSAIKKQWAQG